MELTPYVDTVRQGVHDAAALADENSRQVADRLGQALDASARLALIRALSDAAAEISTELAPGSVELTLNAGEPQFSVTAPRESGEATVIMPQPSTRAAGNSSDSAGSDGSSDSDPGGAEPGEDAGEEESATARISLRLPLSVKERVDRAADAEGVSTNTWLVRAVQEALDPNDRSSQARSGTGSWTPPGIGQIFGPDGPFGAHGVFGPNGVFGGDTPPGAHPGALGGGDPREWARPERPERPARPERPGKNRGDQTDSWGGGWGNGWGNGRGRVQGWVR